MSQPPIGIAAMSADPVSHRRSSPSSALLCLALFLRLADGHRSAATVSDPPKPEIRIAHIHSDANSFASAQFLIRYMNNSNRAVLPDYDIVVDEYRTRPTDSGSLCARWGCEGGDLGTAAETLIRVLSDDTPRYHAITGPYYQQSEIMSIVDLTAAARILHVHAGETPKLSDRSRYPYNFRQARSVQGEPASMLQLCYMNDWRQVVSIWADADVLDASLAIADRLNITTYPQLATEGEAAVVTDSWQTATVELVKSSRIRVMIERLEQTTGIGMICRLIRAQISGMQFFIDKAWPVGWWLSDSSGCTGAELTAAVRSNVVVGHILIAPGVNLPGIVTYPDLIESEKDVPLGCMPDVTPEMFYNSGELVEVGTEEGWVTGFTSSLFVRLQGSRSVESICSVLLALHDALYNKQVSLSSIEKRERTTFDQLAESMMAVDFQAPSGRFRFYENTGDPQYAYFLVSLYNIDGQSGMYGFGIGGMLFPHGPNGNAELRMADEVNRPFIWADGSMGIGPNPNLALFPDCGILNGVLVGSTCEPCPTGTFYEEALLACRTCPLGQFQSETGKSACELAPLGSYVANLTHPSAAEPCPEGSECPKVGTVSPQPCAPGRFAEVAGQSSCTLCPIGTYQNMTGATECTDCAGVLANAVTATIASTSPSQCICPEGSFKMLGGNACRSCLEGLDCPEGSDMQNWAAGGADLGLAFPRAVRGYMTTVAAPLKVYKCAEEDHCPGGPPGSCASRRDPLEVACGECVSGSYENGKECIECGSIGAFPLILTGIFGAAVVCLITLLVNKDVHKTPAASMMILAVSGLLFFNLQTLGIFSAIDIPWQEPVKTLLRLTRVLSFDLDLLQAGCVVGVNPVRSFALRQFVALLVIPFISLTLLVKKHVFKPKTKVLVELSNSLGTLYSVFFISVVISALEPFMCYKHPNDNGESVQSAPSLLCFEGGDHAGMATLGAIALFVVPIPFLFFCMYGIIMYPRKMRLHSSSQYLHATRFLFFRYVPERYYFQIFVLMRSFLLCIIPAAMRDGLGTQVLCITIVLTGYGILVLSLRPWRVNSCNILDCLLTNMLAVLMTLGALFIEDTPQKDALGVLSTIMVGAIIVGAIVPLVYALYTRFAPQYFNYFICHHKAHAAAQARYIKVLLLKKRRTLQVFIDSDNLKEMDALFDIVKSRVRHLVVLLTADTLTRPWCVGEVVSATRGQIPIIRLLSSTFAGLTEAHITSPESYVDSTGCNLREYGIQWEDVSQAFTTLLSSVAKQIELLDSLQGTWRFEHAIGELLKLKEEDAKLRAISACPEGGVMVVTDTGSDEATAAAGILTDRIAPEVYRIMEQGIHLLCNYEHTADSAVEAVQKTGVSLVILSPGCLQSLMYVNIICRIMSAQSDGPAVISINIPGFSFPTPGAISRLCHKLYPSANAVEHSKTSESLNSFFRRISVLYPTYASQETLDTQSDEIFRRIKHDDRNAHNRAKSVGTRNSSSSRVALTETSEPGVMAGKKSSRGNSKADSAHRGTNSVNKTVSTASSSKGGYTWTMDETDSTIKGVKSNTSRMAPFTWETDF